MLFTFFESRGGVESQNNKNSLFPFFRFFSLSPSFFFLQAYLDNSSMELYHGRLDKRPGAIAVRIRWYGEGKRRRKILFFFLSTCFALYLEEEEEEDEEEKNSKK